jgi:uncharacterized nucleotidyltransferase DUF6036
MRRLEPEALLASLAAHEVEYIVVGGYAVAAHGFPRATQDVDICPRPSDQNLRRLTAALGELEAEPIGLDEPGDEFDLRPNLEGLKLGGNWVLITKHGRLDVMQNLKGLGEDGGGWAELRPHAVQRSFLGHECLFCSYEDLLKMKIAAGRDQDRVDVRTLKAQRHDLTP